MHILIDIAIVVIIAGAVWTGYRKGFVLGICGILAIVISFYGANLIADTYYEEFTPILEPFVGGLVDVSVDKTLNPSKNDEEDPDSFFSYTGETNTKEAVYTVTLMSLGRFGLSESAAKPIADIMATQLSEIGPTFRTALTSRLCNTLTKALAFTIVFLLFIIVFTVAANLLNLKLTVPGLDLVNNLIGAGVGFVKAWFIVSLIAWIMRYAGVLFFAEAAQKTWILKFFMNHNIIASILGM